MWYSVIGCQICHMRVTWYKPLHCSDLIREDQKHDDRCKMTIIIGV